MSAQDALIKLLKDGPPFERLEIMERPTEAAKVQYATWLELRILPLLVDMLGRMDAGGVDTGGGGYFGGAVSAGRDVAGGDIR